MKTDNNFILKPSISEFSKVLVLNWKKDKIFDIQGPFKIGSQPLNRNHLFNKLNLFSTPFVCSPVMGQTKKLKSRTRKTNSIYRMRFESYYL